MHVRRGRYLVDQTINNASRWRRSGKEEGPARRRCTLIKGILRVGRYRHKEMEGTQSGLTRLQGSQTSPVDVSFSQCYR